MIKVTAAPWGAGGQRVVLSVMNTGRRAAVEEGADPDEDFGGNANFYVISRREAQALAEKITLTLGE